MSRQVHHGIRALLVRAALIGLGCVVLTAGRTSAAGGGVSSAATAGWDANGIGTINPKVFDLALGAATCATRSGAVSHPSTLTVIDYSKPSTSPRLWVYDLQDRSLLYQELVAHGQGSGENLPTHFSNDDNSHASSLGLFVTEEPYVGKNGYSLRLNGLDAGFNDRARERAIVMHGAPYVSAQVAVAQGRLGRSWGCPALDPHVAKVIIDRVKGGNLLFAYYPDPKWLASSRYLGDCAAAAQSGAAAPTAAGQS